VRSAFTLIELLVVVAIIALLIAVLLPALHAAQMQARADLCMNNQRQLAVGFLSYANDWEDCLPGGTWDFVGPGNSYDDSIPLCWLGSLNTGGDRVHMPTCGTIYRYVGENQRIYKCPDDARDKRTDQHYAEKPEYSYTWPALLTGVPTSLLKLTRWPDKFNTWNWQTDWRRAMQYSPPWLLVEEDEDEYLSIVQDSGWSNVDIPTNRHKQRAAIAHVDGSVGFCAFQRVPAKVDAWKVYYELTDGRIVTCGSNGDAIRFGYLRTAPRLNPYP
jgi:prepilin-type N-terminal cleavage/methylation domain-containing protein